MNSDARIEFLEVRLKKLTARMDRLEGIIHQYMREGNAGVLSKLRCEMQELEERLTATRAKNPA